MLKISLSDQNQLFYQSQAKTLQDNSYLKNENNENFSYIKEKFFSGENIDKAKLLNVGSGIFSSVSDTISYYVGEPNIEIKFDIRKYVDDYIALGFATIGLVRENGKLQTEYQPAKNYWNDNGIDKILRLYTKDEGSSITLYILVTEYGIGYIENRLYELEGTSYDSDKEVPLDTIPQTSMLEQRIDTGLKISALIVVKDDEMQQYPISLLDKIKSLVYTVDRSIVMQHVNFLQNIESFVLFKGVRRPQKLLSQYNSGKKIDFSMIGRVIDGDEGSSIEFINNTNDLVTQSIEENENNIRRISAMTDVPVEFLGLETTDGAIGANSRAMKHGAFIKRIEGIRSIFDKYINIILEVGKYDTEYQRPDVIAISRNELIEQLKIARETNIISMFEAIKRYNGYTDEEAQIELDRINEESNLSLKNIDDSKTNGDTANKKDSNDNKTKGKQNTKE